MREKERNSRNRNNSFLHIALREKRNSKNKTRKQD